MSLVKWTRSKARLRMVREGGRGASPHWIFAPGGPGLGSESFTGLTDQMKLPGTLWHFDFPGDGSNRLKGVQISMQLWKQSLLEAVDLFDRPILVTHSFSGMFALSIPELENKISAFILMNASPSKEWMKSFGDYAKKHPVIGLDCLKSAYLEKPSDQTFKDFTLAAAPYFFTDSSLKEGLALLKRLPWNHEAYDWAQSFFHPFYESQLSLESLPIMVLGGELDYLTPLNLFSNHLRFKKAHIQIMELKGAGHFPWVGNQKAVIEAFETFCKRLEL